MKHRAPSRHFITIRKWQEAKPTPYLSHSHQELPRAWAGGAEAALGAGAESLGGEIGSVALLGHPQLPSSTGAPSRCNHQGGTEGGLPTQSRVRQLLLLPSRSSKMLALAAARLQKDDNFIKLQKLKCLLIVQDATKTVGRHVGILQLAFIPTMFFSCFIAGVVHRCFCFSPQWGFPLSSSYKTLSHHSSICLLGYCTQNCLDETVIFLHSQQTKFHLYLIP